jgi:hypothetical protein
MIDRDTQITIQTLRAEVLRLSNENALYQKEMSESVSRAQYDEAFLQVETLTTKLDMECKKNAELTSKMDSLQNKEEELTSEIAKSEKKIEELNAELEACRKIIAEKDELLKESQEFVEILQRENLDANSIIELFKQRTFGHSSEATKMLNGEFILLNKDDVADLAIVNEVLRLLYKEEKRIGIAKENEDEYKQETGTKPAESQTSNPIEEKEHKPKSQKGIHKPRNTYTMKILTLLGIDTKNLPPNAKLIRRKDKKSGKDVWIVRAIIHHRGYLEQIEQEVGRFNVPGEGPQNSVMPDRIMPGCPVTPSFARFFLEMKISYHISELRILKMIETMGGKVHQSTLNDWIQKTMTFIRETLQPTHLEDIRLSTYTQNDEVRVTVRSRADENSPLKYHTEYIHGMLSTERKLAILYYKEGSRSHEVTEELMRGSCIKAFTSDRFAIYNVIEKLFIDLGLIRTACWVHARRMFVEASRTDKRMVPIIDSMNVLSAIEARNVNKSFSERLHARKLYSARIVDRIFNILRQYRIAGKEYGKLVQRAVNYMLDDEAAFRRFLENGQYEMHNNAAERMFRHIAMGRRNWLHVGSHTGAENLAYMYSLYESCQLNKLDFGSYIEDILTRIMKGDKNYKAMLPNHYKPQAVKSTQETVA